MKKDIEADFQRALKLADGAPDDYYVKQDWLRAGRKVLKQLAKDLNLQKGTFEIRSCVGGQAVSGDMILHHDQLYVCLAGSVFESFGFVRTCQGQKDYRGGRNHNIARSLTYQQLLELCQHVVAGARIAENSPRE